MPDIIGAGVVASLGADPGIGRIRIGKRRQSVVDVGDISATITTVVEDKAADISTFQFSQIGIEQRPDIIGKAGGRLVIKERTQFE